MRLLDTTYLEFKEFLDLEGLMYAIVSHRWTDNEVSFGKFTRYHSGEFSGFGWTKIVRACEIARKHGFRWLWIDTCCIDKRSSAELSEAINSMYHWYERAEECLVLLHDVTTLGNFPCVANMLPTGRLEARAHPFDAESFVRSEWFRRGWTLQELLAPSRVLFFNAEFKYIGSEIELQKLISKAAQEWHLTDPSRICKESIATRMAWASFRTTTRQEDEAYSLLGLFGVNMPLLYGEGRKAFIRLQLEIIMCSNDESVFAWETPNSLINIDSSWFGLLSPSPLLFKRWSTEDTLIMPDPDTTYRHPYSMTNKGLKLTLDIPDTWLSNERFLNSSGTEMHTILLRLNYAEFRPHSIRAIAIKLDCFFQSDGLTLRGFRRGRLCFGSMDPCEVIEGVFNCFGSFGTAEDQGCSAIVDFDSSYPNTPSAKLKFFFPQSGIQERLADMG